ncbi:hypothetical protein GGR53DRAFT_508733 [Hypoxylon sp. FL1150]|nr:hypothetical protein GGR53DRAFT_508733 [Hypoxylon sp. FL1150]
MTSHITAPLTLPETMDFYDIAMQQPAAVNPWKARLALNFKDVAYTTTWVPLPDISKVRRSLDMPACRKLADGSDFFTLPILVDPSTNLKLGDSFDIAVYLQKAYPTSGAGDLFPPQEIDYTYDQDLPAWAPPLSKRKEEGAPFDEYYKFNMHIDRAFSAHVGLMGSNLPLDSQASKDELVRRAGVKSWDDFEVKGQARKQMKESLRIMLGELAKSFSKDTTGPFVLGTKASYADLIVGGWLYMMHNTVPDNEWQEVRSWHGGIFGRLYDGLEKYAEWKR